MIENRHDDIDRKLDVLREHLRRLDAVVVAFSGGVDSALLAAVAHRTLGAERAHAVTAVSPSLAEHDLVHCERLARTWELDWSVIDTDEMADDRYLANDTDRCYWCKSHMMDGLVPVAGDAITTDQRASAGRTE